MNKQNYDDMSFDDLYDVLLKESSAYENLKELLEKKQKSIIIGDVSQIQDLTAKENVVIKQANAFSNNRVFILRKILAKFDKNSKSISLSNLLEISGKSNELKWRTIKNKMNQVIDAIKRLNFENQQLLKTSLALVKDMVKVFFPVEKNNLRTYSIQGKVIQDSKTKVLDYQV